MSKEQYSALEKLAILDEIKRGQIVIKAAAAEYSSNKTTLEKSSRRYEGYGYEGVSQYQEALKGKIKRPQSSGTHDQGRLTGFYYLLST